MSIDRPRVLGLVLLGTLAWAACEGGTALAPDELVRLAVEPPAATLLRAGETVRLTARGWQADGAPREIAATWRSSDESVAVVDPDGVVTAVSLGAVIVEARAGGLTASGFVAVDPDTEAPVLRAVRIDQTRVDVLNKPGSVRLWIDLTDDRSGVQLVIANFQSPAGSSITGVVTLDLVSGTSESGRYLGFLGIPANAALGTWSLASIRADDNAGNVAIWRRADLELLGMAVSFEAVWGGGGD